MSFTLSQEQLNREGLGYDPLLDVGAAKQWIKIGIRREFRNRREYDKASGICATKCIGFVNINGIMCAVLRFYSPNVRIENFQCVEKGQSFEIIPVWDDGSNSLAFIRHSQSLSIHIPDDDFVSGQVPAILGNVDTSALLTDLIPVMRREIDETPFLMDDIIVQ